MTGAPRLRGSWSTFACRYELDVDGVDWLGADGADSPLADAVLDVLLLAAFRPWKPKDLPFGWPRRRRVR
jgi:hypothetical protein